MPMPAKTERCAFPPGESGSSDAAMVTYGLGELGQPGAAYALHDPQEPGQANTPLWSSPCSPSTTPLPAGAIWYTASPAAAVVVLVGQKESTGMAVKEPPGPPALHQAGGGPQADQAWPGRAGDLGYFFLLRSCNPLMRRR